MTNVQIPVARDVRLFFKSTRVVLGSFVGASRYHFSSMVLRCLTKGVDQIEDLVEDTLVGEVLVQRLGTFKRADHACHVFGSPSA